MSYAEVAEHPQYAGVNLRTIEAAGVRAGAAVIDAACGPATLLSLLDRIGLRPARAWAFDADPAMVELARDRVGDWATVCLGSMEELPKLVPVADADHVLIGNAIHLSADAALVLAAAAGALRPGGVLALSTGYFQGSVPATDRPVYMDLLLRARRLLRAEGIAPTPGSRPVRLELSADELVRAMETAGLTVDEPIFHDVRFDEALAVGTVREPMFVSGALPGIRRRRRPLPSRPRSGR